MEVVSSFEDAAFGTYVCIRVLPTLSLMEWLSVQLHSMVVCSTVYH